MEWDSKAVEAFIQMPLSGLAKSMAKVFAEKKARKNKSSKVTMKEIEISLTKHFDLSEREKIEKFLNVV